MAESPATWLDGELAGCHLANERLTRRLQKLLGQIGGAVGAEHTICLSGRGQRQGGPPWRG